ncbi:DUF1028 domain-containing protein [Micromonospora sp. NPDC047753]|uniref:DUF1028 domain-containing protein n=1 Tax=Micromonospora sp. NPDC047753 TaxID=3154817 RepID=UPI0033E50349
MLSADGTVASYTGPACVSWAGDISGHGVICTGNTLVSEATLNSCLARYEAGSGDTLARRLVAGLEAAQAAGGDRNGQQSASLLVVSKDGGYGGYTDRLVDLRVDDHVTPIAELWRLLQVWKASRQ